MDPPCRAKGGNKVGPAVSKKDIYIRNCMPSVMSNCQMIKVDSYDDLATLGAGYG
jgi:hypothetical protein